VAPTIARSAIAAVSWQRGLGALVPVWRLGTEVDECGVGRAGGDQRDVLLLRRLGGQMLGIGG
jgi:hypothetical protein